jgi:hypothetical protein
MLQWTRVCCAPTPHWHDPARISEMVLLPICQTHRLRDETSQRHRTFLRRPEHDHGALLASTRGECLFGVSCLCRRRRCTAAARSRICILSSAFCVTNAHHELHARHRLRWQYADVSAPPPSGRSWPATFAVRLIDSSTIPLNRTRIAVVPEVSYFRRHRAAKYMRLSSLFLRR